MKYQQGCISCSGGITEKDANEMQKTSSKCKITIWKTGFAMQQ
jgi:hypothetical protein